ncbi:MAG: hypothetical protein WCO64_07655 [Actinomycetes bacterium]
MTRETIEDARDEGLELVTGANSRDFTVRLIGGVGVAAHNHKDVPASLSRKYGDIDFVVDKKSGKKLSDYLIEMGYEANQRFNALHGAKRMLFYDTQRNRQIDVFVGEFNMCHSINLNDYLGLHTLSLAPEHLLLTKLQIVELNAKDIVDVVRTLYMHTDANAVADCPGISMSRLNEVTANDWGWYTTVLDNFEKVDNSIDKLLDVTSAEQVHTYLADIMQTMQLASKSTKWKTRSIIGRKKQWYELPEEIGGGR